MFFFHCKNRNVHPRHVHEVYWPQHPTVPARYLCRGTELGEISPVDTDSANMQE